MTDDLSLKKRGAKLHDLELVTEGEDLVIRADVESVWRELWREPLGRRVDGTLHLISVGITPLGMLNAREVKP